MGNKSTSLNASNLLNNKLSVLIGEVNNALKDTPTTEKEAILIAFNNTIDKFYSTLTNPILSEKAFRAGVTPDYRELNKKLFEVSQDLETIYKEINSLHTFVVQNFNTINTLSASMRARIRQVASNLADYKLYARDNLGGAQYFADSFNNMDKLDFSDRLYREDKCSVDVDTGVITLPIDPAQTEVREVTNITIGSASNGILGNNQELGALARNRLASISDSNPDTWVEYELVEPGVTAESLLLELRFTLSEETVVNTIDILTTAFATKKHPKITKIEVSVDGRSYVSLMEELIGKVNIQGQDVINLNPTTENLSGANKLYFKPRKIKYVNIVFQQSDSYIIRTSSGTAYRKAIGIRDINITGQGYKKKGEIVSQNFQSTDEIRKVALTLNTQDIAGLTSVNTFVSHNDGQDWNPIQSTQLDGTETPEILGYNTGLSGAIVTDRAVTQLRAKMFLERKPNAFGAKTGVITNQIPKTEFVGISPGSQSISLEEQPVPSTLRIYNVSYGSVGGDQFYFTADGNLTVRDGRKFLYLPRNPFQRETIKEDSEIIRINNEIWTRTTDLSSAGSNDKVYEFDYVNNIITFGDNTNGQEATNGVEIAFERERVLISADSPRTVMTRYSTDQVLETTRVYRLEPEQTKNNLVLRKVGRVHRLNVENVKEISVVNDTENILANEVAFIDGVSEMTSPGDYSVDYVRGILYSRTLTPDNTDVIINVVYYPKVNVESLYFKNGELYFSDDDYVSLKGAEQIAEASVVGKNVITLANDFIEPRSIRFLTLNSNFKKEVPFKGDGTEFDLDIPASEKEGYYTIDYASGVVYTYSQVSGTGNLFVEYNYTNYYAEYNIAVEVGSDNYTVNTDESEVAFLDKYIIQTFSDSLASTANRNLFKVSYDYIEEIEQNPKELEPYFTPVITDYRLAIINKENFL